MLRLATTWSARWSALVSLLFAMGCGSGGQDGAQGLQGETGPVGPVGPAGPPGTLGQDGDPAFDNRRPLSSLVAVYLPTKVTFAVTPLATLPIPAPSHIPQYVKSLTGLYVQNTVPAGFEYPLANATSDDCRALAGLDQNVVVKWLSELNPTRWQIWVTVSSDSRSKSLARSIRRPIR